MPEHVVPLDAMVRWEPNAPDAMLAARDDGTAALTVRAHMDDTDRRDVALVWTGVRSATMSAPGEEALGGHRLFYRGLTDVRWIGVVRQSALVANLAEIDAAHPRHDPARSERLVHHIVLLKDCTVEVVAEVLRVERADP